MRSSPTPVLRPGELALAAPACLAATFLALGLARLPGPFGPALAVAVALVAFALVVPRPEHVLFVAIALDLALRLDVTIGYRDAAAALGAHAGIELSLTTCAVVALTARLAWEWLCRAQAPDPIPAGWSLPLGVYVAAVLASTVLASDRFLALGWLILLVESALLYVYLVRALRDAADLRFFLGCLVGSVALAGSLIVVQRFLRAESVVGYPLVLEEVPGRAPRAAGTMGSPNAAGSFFAMMLPVTAGVALARFSRGLRLAAGLSFAIGLLALGTTLSRSAMLAAVIGLASLFVTAARRGWLTGRATIAVIATVTLSTAVFGPALLVRVRGDEGSATSRVPLAGLAMDVIATAPVLGVGPDNYTVALPAVVTPDFCDESLASGCHNQHWTYTVHNQYLLVWAETGAVGLLCFLLFLGTLIRNGTRAARRFRDSAVGPLVAGCVAAVAVHMIDMLFDLANARLQLQSLLIVAAVLAAASIAASRDADPTAPDHPVAAVRPGDR